MIKPIIYIDPLRAAEVIFRFAVTTLDLVAGCIFELNNTGLDNLTPLVSVVDPNDIALAANQPTIELGSGFYKYTMNPGVYTEAGLYLLRATTTSTDVDFQELTIGLMVQADVPAGGWKQAGVQRAGDSRVWYLPK